jgi:serine/threonine protein kinase
MSIFAVFSAAFAQLQAPVNETNWFGFFLLGFVVPLVAGIVYLLIRAKRRRRIPQWRTGFDPSAFREQLKERIVRDATGQPPAAHGPPENNDRPRVPKGLIYGGLFGLLFLGLVVAGFAIPAMQQITDPDVAKTAILSFVIGMVVLVLIIGVVIIAVAGIIWGRHPTSPEAQANPQVQNPLPPHPPAIPVPPSPPALFSSGPRKCPVCEGMIPDDSPEGLCPKCLLGRCLNVPQSPVIAVNAGVTSPYNGPSPAPLPADLASKFPGLEMLELLGQGGMGAVYKARQSKLDRIVAVKVLPQDWGKDSAFAERFAREAKALAKLNHPHIVAVHDFGESDGLFYLVMEYVDGANLRSILANGGLEPHEALAIVPQICDALQYAHEECIVHRDIKPENILLDRKGRVKIADFGLAKLIDKPRAAFTLTGSQMVMGTLDYMAPEQRLTPQQVDHRADIYSLGVVFYEMLTGELPMGRFAPPSQKSGVDQRLDGIVFRTLEREPEQRYQRISEVKTDLSAIVGGRSAGINQHVPYATPAEVEPRILCFPIHVGSAWDQLYPGLLRLEADALVLEYSSSGLMGSKFKEKMLPLRLLRHLRLSRHWYGTYLTIHTASLKVLEGIPTSKHMKLTLGLARRDFATARGMLASIGRLAPALAIEIHTKAHSPNSLDAVLRAARPPDHASAGKPKLNMGRRIKSFIGSVYTMFLSRPKNADAATNDPLHEHTAGQP